MNIGLRLTHELQQKFINAAILPLRILLRVTWWKDHLRTSAVRMAIEKRLQQGPAGSESTNPEDQWWWPIVLEEQRKARARGAATGAAMATGRSVSADNDPTDHNMSAEAKQPSSQPPSDQPPSEQVASEQPSEQPSSEQPPSDTSETAKNDLNTPEVPQQLVSCPITSSKSKKKAKKNRKKRKNTTTPQQMDSCNTDSTAEQPFTVISEAQSSASATDPSSITLAGRDIPPADLTSTPTLPSNDDDNTQSKDMSLASKDTLSEQNDSPSLEPPSATCVAPENRPEIMDTVSVTDSLSPSSTPIPLPSPRATSRPPDKSHESTESLEVTPLTESYTHLQLAPVNTNLPSEISPAPHQLSGTDTLASDDEGAGNLGDNHKRRADAIRLIRARTLSRLSPAEESAATELPTPHSEGSSYHQESTDLDQTPSEKAGMSTSKKKNKKKKQKQKQKEKHISDQPSASPSGNETTHHPSGLLPQDATSIASTDTAAEQDLSSQVSPTESVPKETTQVAISHPSLIQPFPMTLKSEERPRRQDRKSCLDPLALEYIPNYQSGDGFLSRPKGSPSTSSSDASEWKQRLGIEISARESRDITKDEGNIASSETTKYQKTTESTSDSPTTLAPSAYSYQRLSTNDTDFSLSLSSSNDQLTTASAFQEKESSKIQDDGTISASRTTDTDHNTTQRTPTAISEIGTDLQTVHSPTIRYPVEERRVVTSQSLILSTEPSLSRRASRTSIRDRLSPIHESPVEMVADEKAVRDSPQPYDQDIRSATEHSHPYLPDTGSTESIAHIAQEFSIETRGNQETRQVELTTPEAVQDHQGIVTSSSAASSNFASSHAHPSPSSTHSGQGASTIQRPQGFFWQLDSHGFPCAKADCDKRCNSWDGASVICPRCGPFSEVRYCGPEHLYADIKQHWAFCGQMTFRHPCRENTIPREQREGPPLLPSRHQWDTPERHRQAVYHSTNRDGDYFIFADWAEFVAAGQPANNVAVRCSNRVLCVVKFDGAAEKDRFHRVLGVCLFGKLLLLPSLYIYRLAIYELLANGLFCNSLHRGCKPRRLLIPPNPRQPADPGGVEWRARHRAAISDPARARRGLTPGDHRAETCLRDRVGRAQRPSLHGPGVHRGASPALGRPWDGSGLPPPLRLHGVEPLAPPRGENHPSHDRPSSGADEGGGFRRGPRGGQEVVPAWGGLGWCRVRGDGD